MYDTLFSSVTQSLPIALCCTLKSGIELMYTSHLLAEVEVMLQPTVNQPVCLDVKHPSGAYDQIFITIIQLWVCWCGVISLTRERVCHIQFLLVLTLAFINQSQSYVTTNGQLASLSWYKAHMWGLRPDLYFCRTAAVFLIWSILSDERMGLSFVRVTVTSNMSVVSRYNLHVNVIKCM
jgi:hypothetical protein